MHEAFIPINDVPTHIMSWGPWIEESFPRKEVVICITGNPGLVGYYTHFCTTVHEQLGPDVPVWVIGKIILHNLGTIVDTIFRLGHAGHDEPPKSSVRKVPPLMGNESKFDLDAQVQHKVPIQFVLCKYKHLNWF